MKKFVSYSTAMLLIAACFPAFADNRDARKPGGNYGNPGVAPPHSRPYGKSYSQWSMEWWLYAMSKPLSVNPFGHGTDGTIGQSGPVWFLGGTFTGDNTVREITVPPGKALFFPVMDAECSTIEAPDSGFHGDNEAELRACAKSWADRQGAGEFGTLFCKVDGVAIKHVTDYRFATPLMQITFSEALAADNNIFGTAIPEGTTVQSVGDGFYLMLNPLPVGTHTLEFNGIQYTIHVPRPNRGIVSPHATYQCKTYPEWGAAWWQWALALPNDQNPWFDETGAMAANGQSGPVWFLTGVINASGTATRHCTIPKGKALFFPVLNAECSNLEGPPWYGGNEAELRECCVVGNPLGPLRYAEIDGVAVQDINQYYALTPMFTFYVPKENGLGVPGPATGISTSHGIWLLVKPLAPGTHVIHFGGGDPAGFHLDITYVITVPPEYDEDDE